ncbi:MAG: zf-HC2 domain-containing protein [Thermoanaerobaculia bacterium]
MERHRDFRELLQMQADGELSRLDAQRLDRHLAGCAACREERRELVRLEDLLTAARVPVRAGFRDELLAALPNAAWESRHPASWAAGVALVLALGGGAFALTSGAGVTTSPLAEIFVAVLDLFRSSLLAGAGLLDASWRGLGLALSQLFAGSWLNLVAFGVFVIGVDTLFLRLLLYTRRKIREAASRRGADGAKPS